MPPDDDDKNIAALMAVELIKGTLDNGGDAHRILSRTENMVLAVFLANERIFGVERADNLSRLEAMFSSLSRRLALSVRESG